MPGKYRMVQLGILSALILTMSVFAWNYGASAADQGPDQAMRSFIDAVVRKHCSTVGRESEAHPAFRFLTSSFTGKTFFPQLPPAQP